MSVREAARRAGISEGWWRQIVKGYQSAGGGQIPMRGSADTVARMAQVVGVTAEQLEEVGREDAAEELRALPAAEGLDEDLGELSPFERMMLREMAEQRAILEEIRAERRAEQSGKDDPLASNG